MRPFQSMRLRSPGGAAPIDPFFANVTSLLHLDGTNGSTTFTDVKGKSWIRSGLPSISTAQFKFGGASLLVNGGYLICGSFGALGAGDFTVEGWLYATATSTRGIFHTTLSSSFAELGFGYDNAPGGKFQLYSSGTLLESVTGLLTLNNWQHWAVVRSGTTLTAYVDGIARITTSNASNFTATTMNLGTYYNSTFPTVGHLDDFRTTVGVARYTSNFTPPTSAFPDS